MSSNMKVMEIGHKKTEILSGTRVRHCEMLPKKRSRIMTLSLCYPVKNNARELHRRTSSVWEKTLNESRRNESERGQKITVPLQRGDWRVRLKKPISLCPDTQLGSRHEVGAFKEGSPLSPSS